MKPMSRADGNLRSIYMMLIAVVMFSLMDTAMKLLSADFPAMQVASLRALSSLPLIVGWVAWRGGFKTILRVHWPLQLLRAAIGIAMLALFAYGIRQLSLAEAYSIFFIAPALITALSVWVLKEQVGPGQWVAIVIGMAGVLVVLRPTGEGMLTLGGLAILLAAALYAVSSVAGRILSRVDSSAQMVFWLMTLMAIGATILAWPHWVTVPMDRLPLLCGLAFSGFFAQLAVTEAFAHGQASRVAPFEYSALAWGVALDWVLWQVLPDRYTLLGAAIIIASGLYLIRREKVHIESEHP
jgi:drug/metabolite transporter (DMT)-like permease